MVIIKPPIIIAEGWDVQLYDSVADAELNLEHIDVTDKIYKSYDAEGRLLEISTNGKQVFICAAEDNPSHAGELQTFLREFLKKVDGDADLGINCTLPKLVDACRKFTYVKPKGGSVISTGISLVLGLLSLFTAAPIFFPIFGLAFGANAILKENKRSKPRKQVNVLAIIGLLINGFVILIMLL